MTQAATKIQQLNDALRSTGKGGRVMMTVGVASLAEDARRAVMQQVKTFSDFTEDNDPHGEHDFGAFELAGQKFFFKMDYYDLKMEFGSEDPADPAVTTRVLTVMLASEY